MFYSDPNLYGVTLPYKDIPGPVGMWHNIPRYAPPSYGFLPPYLHFAPPAFAPFLRPEALMPFVRPEALAGFMRPEALTPFVHPEMLTPFIRPETMAAPFGVNPYAFNPSLQQFHWTRPFAI